MATRSRIAVASVDDRGLDSRVSGHFGRCSHFTVIEVEDGQVVRYEVVVNPHASAHRPGEVPCFIHELDADVILAGGMGHRAVEMFEGYGIEAATGAVGRIRDVVDQWCAGSLHGTAPCSHDHDHDQHGEGCGGRGRHQRTH